MTSSEIRYNIAKLQRRLLGVFDRQPETDKIVAKIGKLREQYPATLKRELKRLCVVLTYKADVYGPHGRIFSHEGKWSVVEQRDGLLALCFIRAKQGAGYCYNPEDLRDGHDQTIYAD